MLFKLETKEKFHVVTLNASDLAASLSDKTVTFIEELLQSEVKNVIISLKNITSTNRQASDKLAALQARFMEMNVSFVLCAVNPDVEKLLLTNSLEVEPHIVPTESEAWDIVQLEELEREFLDDIN